MFDNIKKFIQKLRKNEKYKKAKGLFFAVLFFAASLYFMSGGTIGEEQDEVKEITYNEFIELCDKGEVDTVWYEKSREYMTVILFNEETKNMDKKERGKYEYENKDKRTVLYPSYEEFRKDMLERDINIRRISESWLEILLSVVGSLILPIIWLVVIFRLMGMQSRGIDKKRILQKSDTKFEDIIGHEEIIEDIKFIAELIKNPEKSDNIGAKVPKGVLLEGPPGTGKTLIAKAIAGEAGVPFVSMSGSDFKELYVGVGAKRVRELFAIARKNAPCIIFIDEIDSVGQKRNIHGSDSEDRQTINALLKEMDGFTGREGIFILAATNHPENLDPALVRSGRFDRKIDINPPRDWKVRKELFEHYLKNYKISEDIDLDNLSRTVTGFTGADIAMICNEAGIVAMMHEKEYIDNECIEEAIDKKVFNGNRSKHEAFKKDKEIVAYHEGGHAVMSYVLGHPVARASIIGTTSGVGGAVFREEKDGVFTTDKEMREHIMIAYAGRASEKIKYDVVTTGASNDITKATELMMGYIMKYGFDDGFGLLDADALREGRIIESEEMTDRLSAMSKEVYNETLRVLNNNYGLVEKVARKLLEVETISGDDIKAICEEGKN